LLERSMGILAVRDVDIDPVGAESLQALIDGPQDVPAREAGAGERGARAKSNLGGDDHLIAMRPERRTEQALGFAAGVAIGGIEKVDSGLEGAADELAGEVRAHLIYGAEILVARGERHGTEGETGDGQARIAEQAVLHGDSVRRRTAHMRHHTARNV